MHDNDKGSEAGSDKSGSSEELLDDSVQSSQLAEPARKITKVFQTVRQIKFEECEKFKKLKSSLKN